MQFDDQYALVDWLFENCFETHRGITPIASGHLMAYGNDKGAKFGEVEIFIDLIRDRINKIVAIHEDPMDYTWFVIMDADNSLVDEFSDLLWTAWYTASGDVCHSQEIEKNLRLHNGVVPDIAKEVEWIG